MPTSRGTRAWRRRTFARSDAAAALLALDGVVAHYGKKRVLDGVHITVAPREAIALIGHNGAGKTTIRHTIFGLHFALAGSVVMNGAPLGALDARLRSFDAKGRPTGRPSR